MRLDQGLRAQPDARRTGAERAQTARSLIESIRPVRFGRGADRGRAGVKMEPWNCALKHPVLSWRLQSRGFPDRFRAGSDVVELGCRLTSVRITARHGGRQESRRRNSRNPAFNDGTTNYGTCPQRRMLVYGACGCKNRQLPRRSEIALRAASEHAARPLPAPIRMRSPLALEGTQTSCRLQ